MGHRAADFTIDNVVNASGLTALRTGSGASAGRKSAAPASQPDHTGLMDRAVTERDDVRRVLIVGDTHGKTAWLNRLADAAAESDCTIIIQVGDFGYFPEHRDGPRYLTAVEHVCANSGAELWFIDGNHDDHTSLANLDHNHFPVGISDHVTYLPRGSRIRLGGTAFGFIGGAFSIDWRDRVVGRDWWPSETTEGSDVARLGLDPLDVLITHDAPAGVNLLSSWKPPAADQVRADEVRWLIAQAVTTTTPRLVVHGHWHHGYETELSWIDRAETERAGSLT